MKGLLFTWLITFFGVTGSVFSPFYGLLAYVALAIVKPDSMWAHSVQNGRYSLIVAMAMLASWLFRGCGNWDLGRARPIVMLFGGFWLWCALLACISDSPPHAWTYVEAMAKILLPFLVGVTSCKSVRDLKALAWVIVLCQGYVGFEMNMRYFGGYNYLYFIGFGGHDNNGAAVGFVVALGVAFFLFLNTENLIQKGILGACMAFLLHAILFSFSRGAMLATGIGVGLSFFLIKKTAGHYALFALGLAAALFLAGPEVRGRFLKTFEKKRGQREASAQSRLDMWSDCYVVFKENPILGCGPDHWPLRAKNDFGWTKVLEAHSLWIQTATETGIPGILMLGGFYLVCIWRCWIMLIRLPARAPPWFGDAFRLTIASLSGFIIAAQFLSLETLEIPYYVAMLGAASLTVYGRLEHTYLAEDIDAEDWRDSAKRSTTATATPTGESFNFPRFGVMN